MSKAKKSVLSEESGASARRTSNCLYGTGGRILGALASLPAMFGYGKHIGHRTARRFHLLRVCYFLLFVCLAASSPGENLASLFDQANKLYEQGKYAEAATAYEKLIPSDSNSPAIYFNLGNARYKAGQSGRAIAAYRRAEMLAPRDPNLRFNLNFVRKKVSGSESVPPETWRHRLATLTLNEWTALAMGAFWLWFLLLALREVHPALRKHLGGYTATAGAAALLLTGGLGVVVFEHSRVKDAVVVATNAVVRYGPLEESQVFYQLRDGSEVIVLDEKDFAVGEQKQSWLQVQDATRRVGWVQRDQVVLLTPTQPLS